MQLGTKRNYKVVEEKLLGFVLVYKLACTELHGSDSFVKCVSRFVSKFDFVNLAFDSIRLLIEESITTLSKTFLLFSSSFLSRIQQKESRGTDILGFVLLTGNLRTTKTTLPTTTVSKIPCTAQARLTNFVVVVSSTTPNTVESRRPAIHKLRQV